ncbi:MAG: TldD/PmbA family protein [Solobacterium sp.]|nr:TldD/PmbA family protein [Solobacterium sp.]
MNKKEWISYALNNGFDSFEIYQKTSAEKTVNWYEGNIESYVESRVCGTAFRGETGGKMVYAATEAPDGEKMEDLVGEMKAQAEAISSEDVVSLRQPQEVSVKETPAPVPVSVETVKSLLSEAEKKILGFDPKIFMVPFLEYVEESEERSIVNSNGIDLREGNTVSVIAAGAAAREGGNVVNGYHYARVQDPQDFDCDAFVRKLCTDVLSKLNAKTIKSGTYRVIFEKEAMTALFSAFSGMFSAESVQKGISPLVGRTGQKLFADCITVIDDPANPEAAAALSFDDEGCPTKAKKLVSSGVLEQLLYNTASALKDGTESTGNGFKGSYASKVGIRMHNCCIEPKDKTLEELMEVMQEGYVITSLQGLHAGLDPVTGDFSLQSAGYYVKDGKRAFDVKLVTAAGNFLQMLKNAEYVGSDLEWGFRTVACPSILFSECAVSGE